MEDNAFPIEQSAVKKKKKKQEGVMGEELG